MNKSNPNRLKGHTWFDVHAYGRIMPGVTCQAVHVLREQKGAGDRMGISALKVDDKSVMEG